MSTLITGLRWPPEGPSARIATKRILDVFARSMTRRSALLVASPTNAFFKQGNVPFRPHCGVVRRLFGTAKRRSLLLALRAERHVRKPVISVNTP
ncbi:hypothetical protein CFB43_31885 [Burkholderia sp. AU15512]|nr:hypothetical protein CFB43_31885 [Burkholderia sp. AU15512]